MSDGDRDRMNLATGEDRALLRAGISAGWRLTHGQLAQYAEALDEALQIARSKGNERAITSCVRTMATLVSQVQHDEDKVTGHADGVHVTVVWQDG